ncbi:hypothetical protein [Vibrio sp. HN007]|uniref:hypothetical protein n=1 Tax=Vibrio iocasae TaxID=3098914 RepID=UPI0035D47A8D
MDKQNPTSNTEKSRFSRRKLLQSGIAASPLLLSVKSPVAWGGNSLGAGNCSVSVLLSANVSDHNICRSKAKDECYWYYAFSCHPSDPQRVVREALANATPDVHYYTFFKDRLLNRNNFGIINGWNSSIDLHRSANPDFNDVTHQYRAYKLKFLFTKTVGSKTIKVGVPVYIDRLHQIVATGYLNAMFYPHLIDYIGNINHIKSLFDTALEETVIELSRIVESYLYDVSSLSDYEIRSRRRKIRNKADEYVHYNRMNPLTQLRDSLRQTWD